MSWWWEPAAQLPANAIGTGWLWIDLALRDRVTLSMHKKWRRDNLDLRRPAIMVGSMENAQRGYREAAAGRIPRVEDMLIWCFSPTGIDPSQAPEGQELKYLSTPSVPTHPVGGWGQVQEEAVRGLCERRSRSKRPAWPPPAPSPPTPLPPDVTTSQPPQLPGRQGSLMDEKFIADLKQRMEFEVSRTGPPADWPQLPDLPLGRYTDEVFFRAEMEHVWRRSWQFVGHISQWAEPGAYRTLDLPFAPVVVVRGREDGELRAFLNACRHRGAPVVRAERGTAKYLVCQFHAWTYDLAGSLVQVPDARDFKCLHKTDRALAQVACARWGEFVFINLDPHARPLSDEVASLSARYGDVIESELRPVRSTQWELSCNWKLAVEAFVEIYHFGTVHKKSAAPFADTRYGVNFTHPYGNSSGILPFRTDLDTDAEKALDFFFPPDLRRIAGAPEFYRVANPNFHLFPGLVCPADYTGFPFLVWRPLAVDRTWMELHWYGPDWGEKERPQGWEFKMAAFDVLMQEDTANLQPIQRSLKAAAHKGVPLNYQERRIWHFHRHIDQLIGADSIPDGLGVPDLIAHYQEA